MEAGDRRKFANNSRGNSAMASAHTHTDENNTTKTCMNLNGWVCATCRGACNKCGRKCKLSNWQNCTFHTCIFVSCWYPNQQCSEIYSTHKRQHTPHALAFAISVLRCPKANIEPRRCHEKCCFPCPNEFVACKKHWNMLC